MMFTVRNRGDAEAAPQCDKPHAFVSIRSPEDRKANLPINEHTLGALFLEFSDADVPKEGVTLFTSELAKEVLDFAIDMRRKNVEELYFNCNMGRSRSPAVAAAIALTVFDDAEAEKEFFRRYTPNMLVYRSICSAYMLMLDESSPLTNSDVV
jgi:predicted protein tyrosine phosphatase